MSLLFDPKFDHPSLGKDYFEHVGVKGMRWGVRRKRSTGDQGRGSDRTKEGTAHKVARIKKDKEEHMASYQEHLDSHGAKTAGKVKKMQAEKKKFLDEGEAEAKSIETTGKAKGWPIKTKESNRAEHAANVRDWNKEFAKDYDKQINKYKAKRQKQANEIRTEMREQGASWDAAAAKVQSQSTGKSISSGKASVNTFLTGNPDGRITKKTVAGYAIAGVMIAAMAADMKR